MRRWETMREITCSNVLAGWMFLQVGLLVVVERRPTLARRLATIGSFLNVYMMMDKKGREVLD